MPTPRNGGEPGRGVRKGRLPRRPPTAAHKDKLETIKTVAAELFFWHGYAATDLRRIADETDMHVASLYNYIAGKEDLLFQIMQDGLDEINASLDEALEGVRSLPSKYPGIVHVWTKSVRVQGGKANAFVMEFADPAALKNYTDSPAQKDWYKTYLPIRDESSTFDITN